MTKIKILAAVLDQYRLTLYKEDGTTIEMLQGDTRIQPILDVVTEPLSVNGWAEFELEEADPTANHYSDFQEKTSGVVRFFRVAKAKLKNLFGATETVENNDGAYGTHQFIAPVALGTIPGSEPAAKPADAAPTAADVADATVNQKPDIKTAVDQIMATAQPVTDPNFRNQDTTPDETIIAQVVNEKGEAKIVPGMEHLQSQFAAAAKLGSTEGVTNFLRRISAVIDQRKHTIDELLRFMEKGDLPIADDGSIVSYKVLQTLSPNDKTTYVDCHSRLVKQRIGSYVTQKNVDENRRVECSVGLHIARRGYLRNFSGNIIVLAKIAPEDVIAVPLNEPDKMRCRGYHILSEIPADQHTILRQNRPLQSEESKKLLAMAIKGEHVDILEDVVIGGDRGTNLVITPRQGAKTAIPQAHKSKVEPAKPIRMVDEAPDTSAPKVNPSAVNKTVLENKTTEQTEQRKLFLAKDWTALYAFKKTKKKSWEKLGFNETEVKTILANDPSAETMQQTADKVLKAAGAKPAAEPEKEVVKPEAKVKPAKKASAVKPAVAAVKKSSFPKEASPAAKEVAAEHAATKSNRQIIEELAVKARGGDRAAYQELIAKKRAAKKNWAALGINDFEAIQAKFEK